MAVVLAPVRLVVGSWGLNDMVYLRLLSVLKILN
jgi:hypothetical protein